VLVVELSRKTAFLSSLRRCALDHVIGFSPPHQGGGGGLQGPAGALRARKECTNTCIRACRSNGMPMALETFPKGL
jgi:hypothetical protein